jgi:predicted amidohydrolase YtcJ
MPRSFLRAAAFSGFCTLLGCPPSAPPPEKPAVTVPPRADLVLVSGNVETLDPGTPKASAVAIKEGRIAAVGSDDDIKPWIGDQTRVVELHGKTVLPGLVDSHAHLAALGLRRFGVDLVGTRSLEEVRSRVKKAALAAKKGEWIIGRGWDQNDWESFKKKGLKFPSAKDLDDVSPDHPVMLHRIDGHAIWVNTKAMQFVGVDAHTKAKPGGEIVKGKSGKPSGIFIDNAMEIISDKTPAPSKDELKQAILAAQKECLAAGLVQVHDMGIGHPALTVLRELDQAGELKLRVYAFLDGSTEDLGAMLAAGPLIPTDAKSHLTVRGVKLFIDGALGSRGALLLKPYSDDKKSSGLLVTKPEVLQSRVMQATRAGFQVATHAIGDRGNQIVLDAYQKMLSATSSSGRTASILRPRIEHAQVVAPEDIGRFGKVGIIASMQPTHATSDMPWAESRLGKERLKGAYAWHSLLTANATIAAGSDAPVEDVSPVLGLYAAVTRKNLFGEPEGGWTPKQKMTRAEAVRAYTTGGAWASFRETEAGVIKKGYVADLTVLDKDPMTAPEDDLSGLRPQLTIVGGSIELEVKTATVGTSTTARTH